MKQTIAVKVTFEVDYDNEQLAPYLKEKLKTVSMDQIEADIHDLLISGIKDLVNEDMRGDSIPGVTYCVEEIKL